MVEKKVGLLERAVISIGGKLEEMAVGARCFLSFIYEPELSADIIDELSATE